MKQDERRARTRRLLLDAAKQAFADRGFEGASLDAIAASARLSKGAVYAHFSTKLALYLAVLEEVLADARGRIASVAFELERGADPEKAARAYIQPGEGLLHAALLLDAWSTATREPTVGGLLDEFLKERADLLAIAAATRTSPTQARTLADLTARLVDGEVLRTRRASLAASDARGSAS